MRVFIFLAVVLATAAASAAPAATAPVLSVRGAIADATHVTRSGDGGPTAAGETSIERITRLRAERQGTSVVPRRSRFPHAPDARPAMTLQRMMELLEPPQPCRRVWIRKKPRPPLKEPRPPADPITIIYSETSNQSGTPLGAEHPGTTVITREPPQARATQALAPDRDTVEGVRVRPAPPDVSRLQRRLRQMPR